MNLLLIEDNVDLADTLQIGLEQEGYKVDVVYDGITAEARARSRDYDMLLVDWCLPGRDGVTLLRHLRRDSIPVPAMLLTVRKDYAAQVEALEAGADDYVTKPFSFEVLLARMRALRRRVHTARAEASMPADPQILDVGPLQFDLREHTATLLGEPLLLREKEYQILAMLAQRSNHTVTRMQVAQRVWKSIYTSDDTINTTVSRLRSALSDALKDVSDPPLTLETNRGIGYILRLSPDYAGD